eukprot:3085855-Rhodomonas_salina.1
MVTVCALFVISLITGAEAADDVDYCAQSASSCADGSDDWVFSVNIVGCDGAFSSGSGVAGGNVLCAQGWSICPTVEAVTARGLVLDSCRCPDGMADNMFYATLESWDDCNGDNDPAKDGTDDFRGCGCGDSFGQTDTCGPLGSMIGNGDWHGWQGFTSRTTEMLD